MKVTVALEKHDFDALHDVILDALGKSLSEEGIQKCWDILPQHTQGKAIQWGTNDTVFRDEMHEWLTSMKKVHKEIKVMQV